MKTFHGFLALCCGAAMPCLAQAPLLPRPSTVINLPDTGAAEQPHGSFKAIPLLGVVPGAGPVAAGYFSVEQVLFEADKLEIYGAASFGEQRALQLDYSAKDLLGTDFEFKAFAGYANFKKGYYGRGNDTSLEDREKFLPGRSEFGFALGHSLGHGLTFEAGLVSRAWSLDTEADTIIPLADRAGGTNRFLRLALERDTRDDSLEPQRGGYDRLRFESGIPQLGSDYGFSRVQFQLARYRPISDRQVLALRAEYGTILSGDAPVFELESLGGSSRLRGESGGRFRANSSLLLGAEWRLRVFDRLTFAVFAETGKVWDDSDDLRMSGLHATGGIGVRYRISSGCLLRFDLGLGSAGALKPILDVNQAF